MGSTTSQEITGGTHVEKTSNIVVPNHVQPFAESPAHEGFQDHTHYSPTSGSLSQSQERFIDVFASNLHALEAGGNQKNHVEDLKRLIDSQEGFYDLSPTSPSGHPDNFNELFQQLKFILVRLDLF